MDVARMLHNDRLVEAEELWEMEVVDKDAYGCRGCDARVFPASYDKENNKRRPYFTLGKLSRHLPGCDVDGEERILSRARKERVGGADGFPLPFPSRLSLSDDAPGALASALATLPQAKARQLHHGHTVKTIRPACRTFIHFPRDRAFLPLEIPGLWGNTYAKLFWYLRNRKPEFLPHARHLYYAPLRWTAAALENEAFCELTLNTGEWDGEQHRFTSLNRVRIDWSGWSAARRDALRRECEAARTEAMEAAGMDNAMCGWVFFVGRQDANDPSLFHVDDHRLICCLAAEERLVHP